MALDFGKAVAYTLSANEIRQFCDCPRKRYYSSRDILAIRPRKFSNALYLGSAFHSTLQYYYTEIQKQLNERNILAPTQEDISSIDETMAPFTHNEPLDIENQKVYNCMVAMYLPQILKDLVEYEIIGCELSFNIPNWPLDNVMYHGLIDMVVKNRDTGFIYFFEHKTCRDFRPEIYDRFDIQLHLYSQYGRMEYGDAFKGLILNQVKKAKTERGYALDRKIYEYTDEEQNMFNAWLTMQTQRLVSPENIHEPCNNYMNCKACEYAPICLKYGYEVPKTREEILEGQDFTDVEVDIETNMGVRVPLFVYDPREKEEKDDYKGIK